MSVSGLGRLRSLANCLCASVTLKLSGIRHPRRCCVAVVVVCSALCICSVSGAVSLCVSSSSRNVSSCFKARFVRNFLTLELLTSETNCLLPQFTIAHLSSMKPWSRNVSLHRFRNVSSTRRRKAICDSVIFSVGRWQRSAKSINKCLCISNGIICTFSSSRISEYIRNQGFGTYALLTPARQLTGLEPSM